MEYAGRRGVGAASIQTMQNMQPEERPEMVNVQCLSCVLELDHFTFELRGVGRLELLHMCRDYDFAQRRLARDSRRLSVRVEVVPRSLPTGLECG